jgi:uncharacterized cupredoxin-like copper-binding protein
MERRKFDARIFAMPIPFRAICAGSALAASLLLAVPACASDPATVKVSLLDMTAMFGPDGAPGGGYGMAGPGMMGRGGAGRDGMGRGMLGGMMAVRTSIGSVKAGPVTFAVTNLSRSLVHELIVVAVDNPNTPLPYDDNASQIPEQQIKVLGEIEEMAPNAERVLTVDLKPGTYLLICNVPGHYAAGMWTQLTVTP